MLVCRFLAVEARREKPTPPSSQQLNHLKHCGCVKCDLVVKEAESSKKKQNNKTQQTGPLTRHAVSADRLNPSASVTCSLFVV